MSGFGEPGIDVPGEADGDRLRISRLMRWLARRFVGLPYYTLVNLLAKDELFPEFVTPDDATDGIADRVIGWLNDPAARAAVAARIAALRDRVAVPGACDRAAEFLLTADS